MRRSRAWRPEASAFFALAFIAACAPAFSAPASSVPASVSAPLSASAPSFVAVPASARSEASLSAPTPEGEWSDEIERDFALRSIGRLQITNLRGEVSVQGWALDKIRVKARRRARGTNESEARARLAAVDFRYREFAGDIELSAEYGRGLDVAQRLRERREPLTAMDFIVYAPANLRLRVWSTGGQALVRKWRADVEVRTQTGEIRIEDVRGEQLTLACPQCPVSVESAQASLRCVAGSGEVRVKDLEGAKVYVETDSGAQRIENVRGEQLYFAKKGEILGKRLRGHVEFHTQSGRVHFLENEGFVSGRTESGPVSISMRQWRFSDRALVESVRGDITLSLPSSFAGEVDLWSVHGRTLLEFPLVPLDESPVYGPEPAHHLRGRINGGGEQLRVQSQYGEVQVLRGL